MKRILLTLIFGAVMMAQPYAPRGIYRYDTSFAARIAHGERTGLLSPREAGRLWNMERDLRRDMERAYRSGFGIDYRERARLDARRAQLDREISRQMRDGERGYGYAYPGRRY